MRMVVIGAVTALVGLCVWAQQEKEYKQPEPQAQHQWLQKLVGNWDFTARIWTEEGQEPTVSKGTEQGRMIGDFWAQMEDKGEYDGKPFTGLFTLGFSPEKKAFVGTWVDSMNPYLWTYEGNVDEAGKVLTLSTEGPCPQAGGEMTKFREVLELKSPDHKVLTSFREKDGKWIKVMEIDFRRRPV